MTEELPPQKESISPTKEKKQLKQLLRRNISTNSIAPFIKLCDSVRVYDIRDALLEIYLERKGEKYKPPKSKQRKHIPDDGDCRRGL